MQTGYQRTARWHNLSREQERVFSMFSNYFKIAWRNLFRNKLHTSINLGGLIIGFTIGIIILLVVYAQLSFDHFHQKGERIYQAYQVFDKPEGSFIENQFGLSAGPAYKKEAGAIAGLTRITDGGNHIKVNGKDLIVPVMMADADFFTIFSFPVKAGKRLNPLQNLTDVVLSEEAAKRIFGLDDPIGKTIQYSAGEKVLTGLVSAVVESTANSSIHFDLITRIENRSNYKDDNSSWNDHFLTMYIELKPGATRSEAERQLAIVNRKYIPKPDHESDMPHTQLLPLRQVHFSTMVNGHKAMNPLQLWTIGGVGLLILFIACFNFVNINLAAAFTRSREIGVRKCMGASKSKLFLQLWFESFLVCFLAFILSLIVVNILLRTTSGMDVLKISISAVIMQPGFIVLATCLLIFVSFVAGGYPSWLMIRMRAVDTLKGKLSLKRNSRLRSSLIIAQFAIACIMISCTFIIYHQFRYLQKADTGINQDYIISVQLHYPEMGRETIAKLRSRLAANPKILTVSGSDINMGRGSDHRTSKTTTNFSENNQQITTNMESTDFDYLKTFGVKILEGRDLDRSFATDTANRILISESVARQFREKNLIGKTIGADSNFKGWLIVGIFKDFHLYTMEEPLEPLSLTISDGPLQYVFVKTTAQDLLGSMDILKKEMAVLEPGQDFIASFVNENIDNWYQAEKMMSLLFSIAAAIAIVLSCSGLLAMVLLIIQQRVKEIGIRKVLGASVESISLLVSREFLLLVGIGIAIAIPVSWFLMSRWLESFAYRMQIRWWMFGIVSLSALLISLATIASHTIRAAMRNPVTSLRSE
jgi:putative ABC transport system permease protein